MHEQGASFGTELLHRRVDLHSAVCDPLPARDDAEPHEELRISLEAISSEVSGEGGIIASLNMATSFSILCVFIEHFSDLF